MVLETAASLVRSGNPMTIFLYWLKAPWSGQCRRRPCFTPCTVIRLLTRLMECMQERMVYTPGVTDTRTTAGEAFALGCGVCQDYAHILTALCRTAGIAARYAAGMMTGEGASHAWTEVWDGQFWHGLDPTHNCLVDERYIKLSHGRDFMDAAVDRGCFLGTASQQQTILIKVEEK